MKSKASRKSKTGGKSKATSAGRRSKGGKKDKGGKKGRKGKSIFQKAISPQPPPPLPQPVEPPKPKVWPKGTCIQAITPGPGEYKATCLVGYYGHDPTKKREPAFSFATGGRNLKKPQESVPGPKYDLGEVTRHGPVKETGPVITGRHIEKNKGYLTPGPGHYSPEKFDNPRYHNAPEARLLGRFYEDKSAKDLPGPGNYNVPSSIGDSHPTLNSSPSARVLGRSWDKNNTKTNFTPGPNEYDYDNNAFMKSGPSARIIGRGGVSSKWPKDAGPGPGAYLADFVQGPESPAFSFGIKHAPCVQVPLEN